jgi:hypothetical protein
MTREPTFSSEFKKEVSNVNGMSSLKEKLRNVARADLELPDRTGWLYDQSEHTDVWCILADMLFCVFETKTSEMPKTVVLLPGCSVRSLVYRSVNAKGISTKTVSGIDKYQIIIDDCSSRRKYLFSLNNQFEQEDWMNSLKAASKLDNDSEDVKSSEQRRHSIAGISSRPQGSNISPRYAPSPKATCGNRSSYAWNEFTDDNTIPDDQETLNRNHHIRNSIGDIRRKLRREAEAENSKLVPMKATHFEKSDPLNKKSPTAFQKLRSFGSLESLFRPKRRNSKSEENGETHSLDETDKHNSANQQSPLVKSHSKRLSQSLDLGTSEKGLSKGLVRTASDLKERLLRNSNDKSLMSKIKLKDIKDVNISGYLQYKYLIKWQKLWCVVNKGCLYGFKSQNPEDHAEIAVMLTRCDVTYVSDTDKRYKRLFVFKLTQRNKKSIYLNACDNADLSRWLQILQMESSKIQCGSDVDEDDLKEPTTGPNKRPGGTNGVLREFANTNLNKRHSVPNGFLSGSDCDFSSSTDDNESAIGIDNYHKVIPPQHDDTLKQVWEKDKNYLFNVVRAKLNSGKQNTNGIMNKDINGFQGDGLHIVTDGRTLAQMDKNASVRILLSLFVMLSN